MINARRIRKIIKNIFLIDRCIDKYESLQDGCLGVIVEYINNKLLNCSILAGISYIFYKNVLFDIEIYIAFYRTPN